MKIDDNSVVNMLIVEFLIQWDVPFEAISSSTLQEAMKKLRPAYKLPSENSINNIIDEIYSQKLQKLQPSTITNATLILSLVNSTQDHCVC